MVQITLYPPDKSGPKTYDVENWSFKDGVLWFQTLANPPQEMRTTVPFIMSKDVAEPTQPDNDTRRERSSARPGVWS